MSLAVMIDLETLATTTDAAITQIAAVLFDVNTGAVVAAPDGAFNVYVKSGFGVVQRSTALWWMQQRHGVDFAKLVEEQGVDLRQALERFVLWLAPHVRAGLPLYAHGAPFDFPILRTSFESCEIVPPWSHRNELCTRPLYKELPGGKPPDVPLPYEYAKHDALSDCFLQIRQLVAARRELELTEYVQ